MNFAAHLLLTYPEPQISLGNLLGDMINFREYKALDGLTLEGVRIHRMIDELTDQHPVVHELSAKLRGRHRKYAPVVLDILLDHILVTDWSSHSDMTFADFQTWVYDFVQDHKVEIPERLRPRLDHMTENRWMNDYVSRSGLQMVLNFMDRRARFESNFKDGLMDVDEHKEEMQEALGLLFADIKPAIKKEIEAVNLRSAEK